MLSKMGNIMAGIMILQNPEMFGLAGGGRYKMIKVKDLGHSHVNITERENDGIENDGAALKAQEAALTRDILKGKQTGEVNPLDRHAINWRAESIFTVEEKESTGDDRKAPYSVLNGRHRLDLLLKWAKVDARWNDFEIACDVVQPANDDERRAFIAKGNADAPDAATTIKPSNVKRFHAWYNLAPKPDYLFRRDPKGAIVKATDSAEEGWTSTQYRNETGIGGSNHVPFSSLTRLGRHFGIPVEVFNANRLRIKPQVTVAYLAKKSDSGNENPVTSHLPKGIELRYIEARTNAKTDADLDAAFDLYRAEFLGLLDVKEKTVTHGDGTIEPTGEFEGDGEHALGNEPTQTPAEKEASKKVETAKQKEDGERAQRNMIKDRCTYAFEKDAVTRFLRLPEASPMNATLGNAFDLLMNLSSERLAPATAALGAWKNAPTDNTKANAALEALTFALSGTPKVETLPDTKHMKAAAHATPNTAKKSKK